VTFHGQGESATGCGVVYSSDGEIITGIAALSRIIPSSISVSLASGKTVSATLVAKDASTGLALLKTKTTGLVPVSFPSTPVGQGDWVLAITRTGGKIVSQTGQVTLTGEAAPAAGNPFSGASVQVSVASRMLPGPVLFDANGNLLGLAVAYLTDGGALLVIPAETIASVANELIVK
jgi:serine protease DegQ